MAVAMRLFVVLALGLAACGGRRGNVFVREGVTHAQRYRETGNEDERTKAVGRRGLARARAALADADRRRAERDASAQPDHHTAA